MLKNSLLDSWFFFRNHAIAISAIILPIVAPIDIFTALYEYFYVSEEFVTSEQLIPMLIGFLAYPIYNVGVIFYIVSIIAGEKIDTRTSWRLGVKFWAPYLILSTLVKIAVMFGFMLLIIPGILLAVRYAFAEFDLLLNKSRPLDAMKNSWDSTKEYMWMILGGYVIITISLYVPYYLVVSLLDESSILFLVLDTASNLVYEVLGVLYTIFAFRVYDIAREQHNQPLNQDVP